MARRSFLTPDPMRTLGEWRRYYHMDVPDLSDADLSEELFCLRAHTYPLQRDDWRCDRVRALTAEYNRRHAGSRV